jgi:hypothetical protein
MVSYQALIRIFSGIRKKQVTDFMSGLRHR